MVLWLKRITAVLIAIMTLGLYVPQGLLDASAGNEDDDFLPSGDGDEHDFSELEMSEDDPNVGLEDDEDFSGSDDSDDYIQLFTEQAKEQTLNKLGPKITNKVEDVFMDDIFPEMEEVISGLFDDRDHEEFTYLQIEEQHASYHGEKIFNIYDHQAKKEVARFHVRRDLKPRDGYWFNFHYHLGEDNFETHHDLGEIYWDKNTPPKWMS